MSDQPAALLSSSADSELQETSVIRKVRITAPDGKNYNTLLAC